MPTSRYPRGTVLKCRFPFDTAPHRPGPGPHYCLLVCEYEYAGRQLAAVCYGTSRLDERLLRVHDGMVLSVSSEFIRGKMPGAITHFLADHVALIELHPRWYYPAFQARLDFVREEKRKGDFKRQRLHDDFVLFEALMRDAAADALERCIATGKIGLPKGKTLR